MQIQGIKEILYQEYKDDVTFIKNVMPSLFLTTVFKGFYDIFSKPIEQETLNTMMKFSAGMGVVYGVVALIKMNDYLSRSTEERIIISKIDLQSIQKENILLRQKIANQENYSQREYH